MPDSSAPAAATESTLTQDVTAHEFLSDLGFDTPAPAGDPGDSGDATVETTEPVTPAAPATAPESGDPATPAPADPAKPVSTAPAAPVAAPEPTATDLLKTAVPFTYNVNGQSRTFEGIREIPGQGAIIDTAALGKVRDAIQYGEQARVVTRQLYEENQRYHGVTHTLGDKELRGMDAIRQLQIERAQLDAASTMLLATLADPAKRAELLSDDRALNYLWKDLQHAVRDTAANTRTSFTQQEQHATQLASQGSQEQQALSGTFQQFRAALPSLTDEDMTAAAAHFGKFSASLFRQATAQDAQQYGVRVGQRVIDATLMHDWFKDRAALRANQASDAKKQREAQEENAKRLAKPAVPVKPATRAPVKPSPAASGKKNAGQLGTEDDGSAAYIEKQWKRGKFARTTD